MSECNRCGKEMSIVLGGEERSSVGMTFELEKYNPYSDTVLEQKDALLMEVHYKKQLGAFVPGKKYEICWECVFTVWGVKP